MQLTHNTSEAGQARWKTALLKNPLLYSSAILGFTALVVCSVMASRWMENRRIEQNAREEKARQQLASDRVAVEYMGGKKLNIQGFYATPGAIRRGQTVQVCYDVANAKTVKLEPQSEAVWPSHSRCVHVSPAKDTTYTLTITDVAGNTKSATLTIKVSR